ncbi:transmembrane signal receptor [Lithospermum erythrorhizon]|uniref:Transmembrane signal receptor n=1 Tax=Lithospermum erythrorhizon TaxID=34254 RepID=A0AAV3QNT5_LITER
MMQFLIGLTDEYDAIRNQILVMDPLPTVGKCYSIVIKVEKEKHVQDLKFGTGENSTMQVFSRNRHYQAKVDKSHLKCDNCVKKRHVRVALAHKIRPCSFKQAKESQDWVQAMNNELEALENNETWEVVDLPEGHKPIGCRWAYKIKCKQDGSIDKYKARLLAKGYNQIEDVNYFDSFTPVVKVVIVRILLAIVAAQQWNLHQMDINNAFLHGYLDEDIYMVPPEGYQKASLRKVCKLKRSLYGLKQASRQCNLEFTSRLLQYGFRQSYHEG